MGEIKFHNLVSDKKAEAVYLEKGPPDTDKSVSMDSLRVGILPYWGGKKGKGVERRALDTYEVVYVASEDKIESFGVADGDGDGKPDIYYVTTRSEEGKDQKMVSWVYNPEIVRRCKTQLSKDLVKKLFPSPRKSR